MKPRKRSGGQRRKGRGPRDSDELVVTNLSGAVLHRVPSSVSKATRYLVARLLHSETAIPPRLGFTSALQGEGVTFVSRSVAAIIANDLRYNVCLIDLNWQSPPSSNSDADNLGLADVIRQTHTLDEVMVETNDPSLLILPAGIATVTERPLLTRSPILFETLEALEAQNDHLVLDLPALLVSSDSIPLAGLADAVGLVVRQGVTTEVQVRSALEVLGPIATIGVVLNRSSTQVPKRLLRTVSNW